MKLYLYVKTADSKEQKLWDRFSQTRADVDRPKNKRGPIPDAIVSNIRHVETARRWNPPRN